MDVTEHRFPLVPPPEPVPPTLDEALKRFEGYPIDPTTHAAVVRAVHEWFLASGKVVPGYAVIRDGKNLTVIVAPELPMDADEFERRTGQPPENDDLDRVNCPTAGEILHWQCGWCLDHDQPQSACMCAYQSRTTKRATK